MPDATEGPEQAPRTATLPQAAVQPAAGPAAVRLLCVDDEPHIVAALKRLFRSHGYPALTATSAEEALALLASEAVDIVFSDMRMPGMDGNQFLEVVQERWPDTARVLLTGYADVQSAVASINRGGVYRYLTKPWDEVEILATVRQILAHQALRRERDRLQALTQAQNQALRELNAHLEEKVAQRTQELAQLNQKLKKNYLTSIKVFSNLLEWRGGPLAGHARRVADLSRKTARAMNLAESEQQEIFIAALLHDIGEIALPDNVLNRPVPRLTEEESAQYRRHPVLGEQALMAMDDMQGVAALIRSHHERHDGNGYPDRWAADQIPRGARILAVADTFDDLLAGRLSATPLNAADARSMIARGRGTQFHPEVVDVFLQVLLEAAPVAAAPPRLLNSAQLEPGMRLARDLVSREGGVLLAAGQRVTAELIHRIQVRELRDGAPLVLAIQG